MRIKGSHFVQTFGSFVAVLVLFVLTGSLGASQDELSRAKLSHSEQKASTDLYWLVVAGDDAMRNGLPSLGERFYRRALESSSLDEKFRNALGIKLASTLISQERYLSARDALKHFTNQRGVDYLLRSALISYYLDVPGTAEKIFSRIKRVEVAPVDQAWYDLLSGLLAQKRGKMRDAEASFNAALANAVSSHQRVHIEAIIFRHQILTGKVDDKLVRRIEKKLRKARGDDVDFQFIREYPIALDALGRKEDAIAFITTTLEENKSLPVEERDQLRFLLGLIAGEDSDQGVDALELLIYEGGNHQFRKMGLYALAQGMIKRRDYLALENLLNDLLSSNKAVSLKDEVRFLKGYLMLERKEWGRAEKEMETLLEDYPASPLTQDAQFMLAKIAWMREPSQYRHAASRLETLQKKMEAGPERVRYGLLAADCYFLNGDYLKAASSYALVMNEHGLPVEKGQVLFQQVYSYLMAGEIDKAKEILDGIWSGNTGFDAFNLWRAEWNLVRKMHFQGQTEEAFRRLLNLRRLSSDQPLPVELQLRIYWLEADLSLEVGRYEKTPDLSDKVIVFLEKTGPNEIPQALRAQVGSHVLFLKGEALLKLKKEQEAFKTFKQLRKDYHETPLADQSYLLEARYFSSLNRNVEAQQKLIKLADKYPNSRFAPIALYEASLNAELRGLNGSYEEAISILNRLTQSYPDHSLGFYVLLKQGDLLRKLNNFSSAKLVYEKILAEFPRHPERYRAQIALADTLLAQGGANDAILDEAQEMFERLVDLEVPVDVKVEAYNKWAVILSRKGQAKEAQDLYWELLSKYLLDADQSKELGSIGRYWMSRTVFELGVLLEKSGNDAEAQKIYSLILDYNLPGQATAQSKQKKNVEVRPLSDIKETAVIEES